MKMGAALNYPWIKNRSLWVLVIICIWLVGAARGDDEADSSLETEEIEKEFVYIEKYVQEYLLENPSIAFDFDEDGETFRLGLQDADVITFLGFIDEVVSLAYVCDYDRVRGVKLTRKIDENDIPIAQFYSVVVEVLASKGILLRDMNVVSKELEWEYPYAEILFAEDMDKNQRNELQRVYTTQIQEVEEWRKRQRQKPERRESVNFISSGLDSILQWLDKKLDNRTFILVDRRLGRIRVTFQTSNTIPEAMLYDVMKSIVGYYSVEFKEEEGGMVNVVAAK